MSNIVNSTPFFGVDIDLHDVGVDIRVNDIPVYFDYKKGQLTVEAPSPDSIIDGENSLSISAFLPSKMDKYQEGSYVNTTLFRQELSDESSPKEKLLSLTLKIVNESGAVASIENHLTGKITTSEITLSAEGNAFLEASANIESPFPRWAWQDGKIIENNQENFNSLLETYKVIHSTMKAKDLKGLEKLYQLRAKETAIAYSLAGEKEGLRKLSVGDDFNNDEIELNDLFVEQMVFQVCANGKMARIRNRLNAQPIFYYQPKPGLFHLYKFLFMRNEKDEWVMIR